MCHHNSRHFLRFISKNTNCKTVSIQKHIAAQCNEKRILFSGTAARIYAKHINITIIYRRYSGAENNLGNDRSIDRSIDRGSGLRVVYFRGVSQLLRHHHHHHHDVQLRMRFGIKHGLGLRTSACLRLLTAFDGVELRGFDIYDSCC
jgi:hypothetical protein